MNIRRRWIVVGVVVVALGHRPAALHAQAPSEVIEIGGDDRPWNQGVPVAVREAARAQFLEGNRLFRIPLFAQAAEQYAAALAKWKHPAFYFNLALTQLNLGQVVEARDNLEQALRHGEEPLGAARFKVAQEQRARVERELGQIDVTCQIDGAEITLDGATLFIGPGHRRAWVKAKSHEITARKADYLPEAKRVTVPPGQVVSLELQLHRPGDAGLTRRRWSAWKPWAVVVAGGVAAATGGIFHAVSSHDFTQYDNRFAELDCVRVSPFACKTRDIPDDLKRTLNDARRYRQLTLAGYTVGGGLIATGVVLLYMNRAHLVEQPVTRSSVPSITIAPTVSPEMVGVHLVVNR